MNTSEGIRAILRDRALVPSLLIAVLGLLIYSNTFAVPFQFDDGPNIVDNPLVKSLRHFLSPSSYCSQFKVSPDQETMCQLFKRRYVGNLSFYLNYAVHGMNVAGYHVVNLFIHLVNAILVYFLVLLTFRTPFLKQAAADGHASGIAFFTALLFVSHPIQTQAVTYIVQRFASLSTMFTLLSLVFYAKWRLSFREPGTTGWRAGACYLASLVSVVLAMKTKEIAFMVPVIIAVYDFLFFSGSVKGRITSLFPILLTMLIIPLGIVNIDQPLENLIGEVRSGTRLHSVMSRWDYLLTQFTVVATYVRLLFFPLGQNLDYDYPRYHAFFQSRVFLSFLLLVLLFGSGLYLARRSRTGDRRLSLIAFGIFLFFLGLSVESSIIPIEDVIFEHRVYLPSIGAFLALTAAFFIGAERSGIRYAVAGRAVVPLLAVVTLVLAGAAYARNAVWKSPVSLWRDVVSKSPNKARAHYNLANAYKDQDDLLRAEREWELTVSLDPQHARAYSQLGNVHYLRRSFEQARAFYEQALTLDRSDPVQYYNMALVSEQLHDQKGAVSYYEMFVKTATPEYYYLVPQVNQKLYSLAAAHERDSREISLRQSEP